MCKAYGWMTQELQSSAVLIHIVTLVGHHTSRAPVKGLPSAPLHMADFSDVQGHS